LTLKRIVHFHSLSARSCKRLGKTPNNTRNICTARSRVLKTAHPEVGMNFQTLADKALAGIIPEREELQSVLAATDEELPELLSAAFRVRRHYYGKRVQIHVLQNAKSGLCPEDCHYCSQSSVSHAPIDRYPFMAKEELVERARQAQAAGAVRFCIVNSGRGPTNKEIDDIAEAVREIRRKTGMNVCCSLGLMNEDKAQKLKDAGVGRVNHNLNTSRAHHPEIVTTHTYDDRVATIENVKHAGIGTCSGGIIGMGESDEDIIDLALTLRAMDIDSIPVNFLNSIPTTPFERKKELTPQRCLKTLCLFRFVNPAKEIRVAGGREVNLRSLQPLSLYPANSIFVNGYLTTPGQQASDAHQMIADLGFELDSPAPI
jgi:biotin synthase